MRQAATLPIRPSADGDLSRVRQDDRKCRAGRLSRVAFTNEHRARLGDDHSVLLGVASARQVPNIATALAAAAAAGCAAPRASALAAALAAD